jgi:RNA polymerase sigma factor for flagellar operon FliA
MYDAPASDKYSELLSRYGPLVKRIGHHLLGRLPDHVQFDDLLQVGMMGLIEASQRYDSTQGASFETFAGIRIRGAMMDEVRRNDWVPRSVHKKARDIGAAIRTLESRLGRDPFDREIADFMDISLDEYHSTLSDSASGQMFSIDAMQDEREQPVEFAGSVDSTPDAMLQKEQLLTQLTTVIDALPEREKLVISLYYDEELNLKEIGQVLGIGESRVSQILSQAVLRIKSRVHSAK